MNEKGFTLVELLAVIVIIGLLSSIAVVAYNSFIDNARERVYKTYEDTMKAEAEMYYINNTGDLPTVGNSKKLRLSYLLANNKIDKINNPDDENETCSSTIEKKDSFILIERGQHIRDEDGNIENHFNLTYTVCLKCGNNYETDLAICKDAWRE